MLGFLSKLDGWRRALLALLALYLALWPLEPLSTLVYSLRVVLQALLYLLAAGLLVRLAVRGLKALTRRFLWRVRHRMAVAYFFVGVVPLSLAILLATFAILLAVGPVAAYLVTAELEERAAELYATVDSLAWEMRAAPRDERGAIGLRFLDDMRTRHSGILARLETPEGPVAAPPEFSEVELPEPLADYRGLVLWEGNLYLSAYAQYSDGTPSLLAMPPLTEEYLAALLPDLGVVELREQPAVGGGRALQMAQSPLPARTPAARAVQQAVQRTRPVIARLPPPAHPFDWALPWPAQTAVLVWETGTIETRNLLALRTRPSAVFRHVLSRQSPQVTALAKNLGLALAILFGGALLVSTIVAVSLTRTVTGAINELYVGTRHVDRGDFSYRVPVRGRSQLTELARSFNAMTASIERLIVDSKERERLESELHIAHEVQAQLFPRSTPRMKTIEALGVCKPAQSVSGDFYDYVQLGENRLALSFGDVSGKGISAALVMAAVHSTLRTQLALLGPGGEDLDSAAARVVAEANRQLCAGTAPEKFATLFFGIYDEPSRRLHYCNAGHLPPMLCRGGRVSRLEVNGMVVGAFSHAEYEGSSIDFLAGDLLCAFTDGISEPENPYGEDFSEERLSDLIAREADRPIQEIIRIVLEEVAHWSAGAAASVQDDQTVLLARGL